MTAWPHLVHVWVCVIICTITSVSCLDCYQCNSTLDYNCQEMFDYENNPLAPTPCSTYEATYCIKATGIWGGVAGTHRFCSSKDMGDQCQYIRHADHDRLYQACIYTCTAIGCNRSIAMSPHLATFFATAALMLFTLWHHH